MLDPNTNTRREFTENMQQNFTIPDDAAEQRKQLAQNLKELHSKLAFHDAMKPNIDQILRWTNDIEILKADEDAVYST